jgi:KDO2-lipid IV(A) lauroyltransferase
MDNITLALGSEYSSRDIKNICRLAYANIATTMLEIVRLPKKKELLLRMVEVSNPILVADCLRRNRPLIIVSAHFGSWEIAMATVTSSVPDSVVMAALMSNPYVDAYITRLRSQFGKASMVKKHSSTIKPLIQALRNNKVVGLISDQDAGEEGVFVEFFGRPTSTPVGPAQLALRYNASIVLSMARRTGPGRYRLQLDEVEVKEGETVATITQRYTSMIERTIRQYPDQYFWMHRRWKSRKAED